MRSPVIVPSDSDLADLDDRQWVKDDARPRTEARRDRDRILYSSALKRLGSVTQVTASETGLTFHSRLTHSLKVAQFARRLAERLRGIEVSGEAARVVAGLNEDAAEAAALAHDLGHPPFGHLAEEALDELAASFGGFEGNAQSFRILTRLALRAETYNGLDLTRRTLNGVLKYPWTRDEGSQEHFDKWNAYSADEPAFNWVRDDSWGDRRSIEAEIMDWADDVTYAVHDMDDFFRAGLVPLDRLVRLQSERSAFQDYIRERYAKKDKAEKGEVLATAAEDVLTSGLIHFDAPYSGAREERIYLREMGSGLINQYINAPMIENDDEHGAVFTIEEQFRHEVDALKELIWCYVIERPSLAILQAGQRDVIHLLYDRYEKAALAGELKLFPTLYVERLKQCQTANAKKRTVVDLVSSFTEAGALEVHRRFTGAASASIIDPTGRLA
jgi:dGTPase